MTNNFEKLNDISIFDNASFQAEIFEKIEKIEQAVINKDKTYEWIGNATRIIAEEILLEAFDCEGPSLGERIALLKNKIYLPTLIYENLYFIKRIGNMESHGVIRKSDRAFRQEIGREETILCLNAMWFILFFVISQKFKDFPSENLGKFDRSFYEKTIDLSSDRNTDLDNQNSDIKSNLLSIAQLIMLKDYVFNIPTYQRDYKWSDKNVDKFLEDIETRAIDGKTHYMGALAIASDENKRVLRIVDGQQRITTSLIFLRAFWDVQMKLSKVPQNELSNLIKKIGNIYVNQKILTSQKAVESVLRGNAISSDKMMKSTYAFKNYDKFFNWLIARQDKLDDIYTTFVSKFQVAVLTFDTTIDNEMDIYENLNTGGVKLNGWDLIKNYIFSRLDPNVFLEKEFDVNQYINNHLAIPLAQKSAEKIGDKLAVFFTQYVRLQNLMIKQKVWEDREVHETFKALWPRRPKFTSYNEYIIELNVIIKYFNIYLEVTELYKLNTSPLHMYSHILDFLKKDDIVPLLMFTLEKNCEFNEDNKIKKIKNETFYKLIKAIENYFVRLSVVKGFGQSQAQQFDKYLLYNSTNISDKTFYDFAETQLNPSMISIDEFEQVLATKGQIGSLTLMNILTNIEHSLRGIGIKNATQNPFEKTYEHIIATQLPFSDYDDKNVTIDEYAILQTRWKDSIGNALILSKGDNSSAGNKPFQKKKPIYARSSALAKGNEIIMNLITKDVFTYEDVEQRSMQIAEFAKKVFKYEK